MCQRLSWFVVSVTQVGETNPKEAAAPKAKPDDMLKKAAKTIWGRMGLMSNAAIKGAIVTLLGPKRFRLRTKTETPFKRRSPWT